MIFNELVAEPLQDDVNLLLIKDEPFLHGSNLR
jgi:hypothetical protein